MPTIHIFSIFKANRMTIAWTLGVSRKHPDSTSWNSLLRKWDTEYSRCDTRSMCFHSLSPKRLAIFKGKEWEKWPNGKKSVAFVNWNYSELLKAKKLCCTVCFGMLVQYLSNNKYLFPLLSIGEANLRKHIQACLLRNWHSESQCHTNSSLAPSDAGPLWCCHEVWCSPADQLNK